MADLFGIMSSNYLAAGASNRAAGSKYVNVDPDAFQGTWSGKYANNQRFEIQVSDLNGFRAKVKYQSGGVLKYQDVLIRDSSFRIADSKFVLTRPGVAQVKTVMTNPSTGASSLETAFAKQGG